MNLTTRYLGLTLAHPFMPGASPLADDLDSVLRLEDAGAPAIVMRSLFEEQILRQRYGSVYYSLAPTGEELAASSYFPGVGECPLGPDDYLDLLRRVKKRVDLPVIASLNGTTSEGWLHYAQGVQAAGADALEINFYYLATDRLEDAPAVERRLIDIVAVLVESVTIPVAVKLSPFYSALPHLAGRLESIGAAGLVLFNRFYQPDIDPEALGVVPRLEPSTSSDLLLRLRWLAILSGTFRASLAVSGGVHEPVDAVKAVMAGADVVQLVSVLLRHGPRYIDTIRGGFARWGDEHEYASIDDMRDKMSLRCADPHAFERGNYMRILQEDPWKP